VATYGAKAAQAMKQQVATAATMQAQMTELIAQRVNRGEQVGLREDPQRAVSGAHKPPEAEEAQQPTEAAAGTAPAPEANPPQTQPPALEAAAPRGDSSSHVPDGQTTETSALPLSCAVCHRQMQEPKLLPCLHTCCRRCVQHMAQPPQPAATSPGRQSAAVVTCPVCEHTTSLPVEGAAALPTHVLVQRELDAQQLLLISSSEQEPPRCAICAGNGSKQASDSSLTEPGCSSLAAVVPEMATETPAVARCLDCAVFLCSLHQQAHAHARKSTLHRLLPLREFEQRLRDGKIGPPPGRQQPCEVHDWQGKCLFCEECEEAVCRECVLSGGRHEGHRYVRLADAKAKCTPELTTALSGLHQDISQLETVSDSCAAAELAVHAQDAALRAEVDRFIAVRASPAHALPRLLPQQRQSPLLWLALHTAYHSSWLCVGRDMSGCFLWLVAGASGGAAAAAAGAFGGCGEGGGRQAPGAGRAAPGPGHAAGAAARGGGAHAARAREGGVGGRAAAAAGSPAPPCRRAVGAGAGARDTPLIRSPSYAAHGRP
jgi:hypothetical protein